MNKIISKFMRWLDIDSEDEDIELIKDLYETSLVIICSKTGSSLNDVDEPLVAEAIFLQMVLRYNARFDEGLDSKGAGDFAKSYKQVDKELADLVYIISAKNGYISGGGSRVIG